MNSLECEKRSFSVRSLDLKQSTEKAEQEGASWRRVLTYADM